MSKLQRKTFRKVYTWYDGIYGKVLNHLQLQILTSQLIGGKR